MSDQATELRDLMKQTTLPRSAPTGAVSFGPVCSPHREMSHRSAIGSVASAAIPRTVHRLTVAPPQSTPQLAHAIAISSGKGGVGKSNLAVNLAVAMSQMGLKVCLVDADLGLANADVLCNLAPRLTLEQVVGGQCRLAEAMMLAPGGFRLIPGASGVTKLADLNHAHRLAILEQLAALEQVADVILIDCGAGINANVVGFASAANTVVVATTPEPTAITDCYSMIKAIVTKRKLSVAGYGPMAPDNSIHVAVNMVCSDTEAANVFNRINRVSRTFLQQTLEFGGSVPMDIAVPTAVRKRIPFVLHAPDSAATQAVRQMAARLAVSENNASARAAQLVPMATNVNSTVQSTPVGFFSRLAVWLGIVEYVDDLG